MQGRDGAEGELALAQGLVHCLECIVMIINNHDRNSRKPPARHPQPEYPGLRVTWGSGWHTRCAFPLSMQVSCETHPPATARAPVLLRTGSAKQVLTGEAFAEVVRSVLDRGVPSQTQTCVELGAGSVTVPIRIGGVASSKPQWDDGLSAM